MALFHEVYADVIKRARLQDQPFDRRLRFFRQFPAKTLSQYLDGTLTPRSKETLLSLLSVGKLAWADIEALVDVYADGLNLLPVEREETLKWVRMRIRYELPDETGPWRV